MSVCSFKIYVKINKSVLGAPVKNMTKILSKHDIYHFLGVGKDLNLI